ncbi:MAG: hypothetical protein ACLT9W_00975 [Streptococcus sp.]
MISRDAFLERINQEGFSFSIEISRRSFSDFTSLVRRRRISEEDLYQLFYNYCQELENCLKEAGEKRRLLFNKFPVSPVHDKYKTGNLNSGTQRTRIPLEFVFSNDNRLKVYHLIETVNGRRKKTPMEILMDLVDAL